MNNVPLNMSKSEKEHLERTAFEDPLVQTLSDYTDSNTRSRGVGAKTTKKDSSNIQDINSDMVTKASMVVPIKWDGDSLSVEKNIKTSIVCGIPASVNNGRWSASMSGSSIVRGQMGCASGAMNLVYHPSIVNGSQLHGGLQVGDQAAVSVGASIRQGKKSSLGVSVVSKQRTSSLVTSLSAQYKFDSCLVSSKVTVGPSPPNWNVSVSPSLKQQHKLQLGLGWNHSQPLLSIMLLPNISTYRRGRLNIHWRPSGGLNIGAAMTQSLASKVASLGVGVQWCKNKLEWVFTLHRGDVTVQVPIHITQYSNVWMNCLQVAYLSFVSQVIQDAIADLWKLNINPNETEALRQEQERFKRDKARSDAERQKQLMLKQAQSRTKAEQAKQGLVIRRAVYQVKGGDSYDVTTQLQFWTFNSSLELPPSSKKDLLGFYNVSNGRGVNGNTPLNESWLRQLWKRPAEKEESKTQAPSLSVQYYYSNRLYEITVLDDEQLILPSSKAVPAAAE